jgi:hypothetical protein
MNRHYYILILLLISLTAHAQPYETNPDFNRTRNWHFGDGIGLRFDPDTILVLNSAIITPEAAAVHSDQDGNLLLYSNGQKIWNANHEVIYNGNLALGHISSSMGSVFIIHEDNPNFIYLFNTNYSGSTNKELSYNLIVKEADTFRVVFKDSVLQTGMSEPIAVVKADNNRDIWIVTHVFNGSNFVVYNLTQEGIISCPIQIHSNSYTGNTTQSAQFDLKFSTNGEYLVKSNRNILNNRGVELYKFNNHNGSLTYLFPIDGLYLVTGISLSKNNENLFVIERDSFLNVFSFNALDSTSTINSRIKIFIPNLKFEIQNITYSDDLALSIYDSSHLALIINTNSYDIIDLSTEGISLNGGKGSNGLPNFNQSYFHTPSVNFTVKLNCVLNTIQFYGQDTFNANTHNWKISKQGSTSMTLNLKSPLITFDDTGVFTVSYIASNGTISDTVIKTIDILPKTDRHFLGNDTGWCEQLDASITLQAPSGMYCYEWSNGSTESSITVDTTGIYWAKIVTPNFCVLYDTITIAIDSIPNIPSIYKDNDTLKTDAIAERYQWLKDGIPTGTNSTSLFLNDTGVYSLKIISNGGCYAISDTIHIPDTSTNSINLIELKGIKIYPNPFNNKLEVIDINNNISKILVYTLNGQIQFEGNSKIIDTSLWNEGVYLIEITLHNGETVKHKLIKQNN